MSNNEKVINTGDKMKEEWIDAGNMISFDLKNKRIHIKDTFLKKNYKMIDFSDVVSIEEHRDSKVHVKRGDGSAAIGGMVAGALGGSVASGMQRGKGVAFYKGLARMKLTYRYKGAEKAFYMDNSLEMEEFLIFRQCCEEIMDITVTEE